MTGLAIALLVMSVGLCALGFLANTDKYENSRRSPGAFWTPSVALLLPASYLMTDSPFVLALNFGILGATAAFWAFDSARRSQGVAR